MKHPDHGSWLLVRLLALGFWLGDGRVGRGDGSVGRVLLPLHGVAEDESFPIAANPLIQWVSEYMASSPSLVAYMNP